ncbi:MAG TPA: pyrroline-5-carboxylate reductase dimerization domain-containing protein [Sphingomonas sp.]
MTEALVLPGRMLMVGCGNMGRAMLDRWLASGLDPAQVTVVSPSGRAMPAGVEVVGAIPDGGGFDMVVLALKPQQLGAIRRVDLGSPRLLLSILAGVEVSTLALLCPGAAVVRAMPNLPVRIGRGVTALYSDSTDAGARATAEALARPLGLSEWIDDEARFEAVTALAGCGPGFVFRFADALAAAGAALGLPADQAMRLALATLEGSAIMAAAADATPRMLADRVASPGGSTREGLNILDRDDALVRLMTETLAASARRNAEMAAAARA